MKDINQLSDRITELFKKYDKVYLNLEQILIKFRKIKIIKDIIKYYLKENFNDYKDEITIIHEFEKLIKQHKLKFFFQNLSLPKVKPNFDNPDYNEKYLKESIERIEIKRDGYDLDIVWKSCSEIFQNKKIKNCVILPKKIDYSNFNQGSLGDCYFISCVHDLSSIPQLLNFILRLSSEDQNNEILLTPSKQKKSCFTVNFFIDGKWKIIKILDKFPVFILDSGKFELVGVHPKNNELFLMILEKAWAVINGGYDKIEGGINQNIFELFLGCKYDEFNRNNDINKLYNSIKANEKFFGSLSLCSRNGHAYQIIKTLEISKRKSKGINDTCNFLIISNPHGKNSQFDESGIDKEGIEFIEHFLEKEFGLENRNQYQYYIEQNKKYPKKKDAPGTGIIYMPLEYFEKWFDSASVCYCHFDCLSYNCNTKIENECLHIYEIQLKEKQLFTCQILLQSYRAHGDEIDKIFISLINEENKEKNIYDYILLYFCLYGIKIIKKNQNFDVIKNSFSYGYENEFSSIRELNTLLEQGEYYIFIYLESSLNQGFARFLSEKEIRVNLVDIINKNRLESEYNISSIEGVNSIFKNNENTYKEFLNQKINRYFNSNLKFEKEFFLPGIREYYIHFKKLVEEFNKNYGKNKYLCPEDAIYSISKNGDAYYYGIIDPNSMNKIFGKKEKNKNYDKIHIETLQFRDNLGFPYTVSNYEELINEMKINRKPISCLFSEYDKNTSTIKSGITYFKLYDNKPNNESILIVSDKCNDPIERNQKPLFIIILDISGSMKEYYNFLQNNVIPKLLNKLGYSNNIENDKDLKELIKKKGISNYELLQAMSSEIRRKNFFNRYGILKKGNLNKFCNDIVVLITFSDDSKLCFFDATEFETCHLCGNETYFEKAADYLDEILNSVSRERSIRMLSFSDGDIHDKYISNEKLEKILNSPKSKHQINSVSVRIIHDTPNTQILMKLSKFSHPIKDMNQIEINPDIEKNIDEVVDKIYIHFEKDGMNHYLKLIADIDMFSGDFSNNFCKELYFDEKSVIRIKESKSPKELEKLLQKSPLNISIEKSELNENNFYDIISKYNLLRIIGSDSHDSKCTYYKDMEYYLIDSEYLLYLIEKV